MSFSPGDVVVVAFPFTDEPARKKRPAVVVSPNAYSVPYNDIVFLALTSKPQGEELRIQRWREVGLLKETWCKPVIASVSAHYLVRHLGKLHQADVAIVQRSIELLIDEQFRA